MRAWRDAAPRGTAWPIGSSSTCSRTTGRSGGSWRRGRGCAPDVNRAADQLGGDQGAHAAEPAQHARALHVVVVADRPHATTAATSRRTTIADLPAEDAVADLFVRRGEDVLCAEVDVMFAYFAQWFTDGFLRSDRTSSATRAATTPRTRSTCCRSTASGRTWTEQLRAHEGGRLKSQTDRRRRVPAVPVRERREEAEFSEIQVVRPDQIPPERRDDLFAAGSDTMNSQIGFVLMNALFLREHNRIAGELAREYPAWDDERLFQTARNILIVVLIKLVIEEYINHIAPYHFQLVADPAPFKNERWYRHELDGDRVQPALPLARPDPDRASRRRRRRADLAHRVQPGAGRRARARAAVRRRLAPARRPRRPVQHRAGAARGRARQHPPGPRRPARAVQRLPRAGRLPARHRLRPDLRATRRSRPGCATSTATSTGSSSTRACSPRTRGPTRCCRR